MRSVRDISNLENVPVLVRVDFNVPVTDGVIQDTFRITSARETITFLQEAGARIILMSHIGRDATDTLQPVYTYLREKLDLPVSFCTSFQSDVVQDQIAQLRAGEILLLENLRQQPGEVANDPTFAERLADWGELYVNEAFAVSHRAHASVVGVPQYIPAYAGIRFAQEIHTLTDIQEQPPHPFVCILGGAKFDTKLPLIEKFLDLADTVFVAGALMNEFFEDAGYEVGRSVTTQETYDLQDIQAHPGLMLPEYVLVEGQEDAGQEKHVSEVEKTDMIVDVGMQSLVPLAEKIQQAKTVLWNGPTGLYENGYTQATDRIASLLKNSAAHTVVGGGDTVTCLSQQQAIADMSFVSTGGGALLTFLSDQTLPGLEALA